MNLRLAYEKSEPIGKCSLYMFHLGNSDVKEVKHLSEIRFIVALINHQFENLMRTRDQYLNEKIRIQLAFSYSTMERKRKLQRRLTPKLSLSSNLNIYRSTCTITYSYQLRSIGGYGFMFV